MKSDSKHQTRQKSKEAHSSYTKKGNHHSVFFLRQLVVIILLLKVVYTFGSNQTICFQNIQIQKLQQRIYTRCSIFSCLTSFNSSFVNLKFFFFFLLNVGLDQTYFFFGIVVSIFKLLYTHNSFITYWKIVSLWRIRILKVEYIVM